jgi:hypothetical protein
LLICDRAAAKSAISNQKSASFCISAFLRLNFQMKTTLDLPDPLFRELKTHAVLRGLTLKALLASLIEAGLRGGTRIEAATPAPARQVPPFPVFIRRNPDRPRTQPRSNAELHALLEEEDLAHYHAVLEQSSKTPTS